MAFSAPPGYYDQLAQIESGGNPFAKAPTSSASGLFQFIKGTWEGLGFNWADRFDTKKQYQAVNIFTQQNAGVLSGAGIPISSESLYAAHFLGAGTARNVLGAPLNAPVANYVSQGAIAANQSILGGGKTVGDFWDWLRGKFGSKPAPNQGFSSHIEGTGDVANLPVISGWDIANPFKTSFDTQTGSWNTADPFGVIEAADNMIEGAQETIADVGARLMSVLTDVAIRGGYIVLGFILFAVGIMALTKSGGDFTGGFTEGVREAINEAKND